jgi:hypothetical protein
VVRPSCRPNTAQQPHAAAPFAAPPASCRRDPRKRPSAREALQDPWLLGNVKQRSRGAQLSSVVQRLQRYNQQNVFKRTVLDMMANELLRRHLERLEEEDRQMEGSQGGGSGGGGDEGGSEGGGAGGRVRGGGGIGAGFIGGSLRGGGGGGGGGGAVYAGGSLRGGSGYAGGSLRGSMTALEALRRARERRGQSEAPGAVPEVRTRGGDWLGRGYVAGDGGRCQGELLGAPLPAGCHQARCLFVRTLDSAAQYAGPFAPPLSICP